jgi:hypothetical protein
VGLIVGEREKLPFSPLSSTHNLHHSDAAGYESNFDTINEVLINSTTGGYGTGKHFDLNSLSVWFTYINTMSNTVYQIWYDDIDSLIFKYGYSLSLRGTGVSSLTLLSLSVLILIYTQLHTYIQVCGMLML